MTNEFDIIDHPLVLLWFKEFAKNEPLGFSFLTKGNINYFKSIWGPSSGQTQKFAYWKKEYLGINIYIYSDETATFYKVQYLGEKDNFINDKKMGSYLIGFLTKFNKELIA
jgi:hypothetical protein